MEPAVVHVAPAPARCAECPQPIPAGGLLYQEGEKPLCLSCALLASLVLVPSGDPALTRRAAGHSRTYAVVMEWSRRRKRFERRGTLVEPAALRRAQIECEADAGERAVRRRQEAVRREAQDRQFIAAFVQAIKQQFPGCPLAEAREIAAHACEKHSGRVGRTAAAKDLAPEAVRLAVIAHVRHLHTGYDQIIERTRDKRLARARIRGTVESVLREWQAGVQPSPE